MMTDNMFTSRSAVEAYKDCNRYRYHQYIANDGGFVTKQKSVPLVSGGAIHEGIGHLLNRVRLEQVPDVEAAIQVATRFYEDEVRGKGFRSEHIKTDYQQWHTYQEQLCLIEGLIRCWHLVELPRIVEKYKVEAVEREIEPIRLSNGVFFQARVDAELRDKETGDLHAYSLKSMKQWGEREEASYENDLQGLTETWAMEQDIARQANLWGLMEEGVGELLRDDRNGKNLNLVKIKEFFGKKKPTVERVMAVRFCFLIKGVYKKSDFNKDNPLYITYSPLTRGYKRITPSSIEYAHSWFYPNASNYSGKSALGKGWEPFNVWEMEGGAKKWFEMLQSGEIQPECGNVIEKQVITPLPYYRDEEEIKEAIREIAYQEEFVREGISRLKECKTKEEKEAVLAKYFSHNRKHCEFHFGGPCEYKQACWAMEVKENPLGSGIYEKRVPHHEAERENI